MTNRYEITTEVALKDAARPYAVVATFRTFNKVVGRYATAAQAKRRIRALEA